MNASYLNHVTDFDGAVHEIYCGSQIQVITGELELQSVVT